MRQTARPEPPCVSRSKRTDRHPRPCRCRNGRCTTTRTGTRPGIQCSTKQEGNTVTPDYYQLLGLAQTADLAAIKTAYRKRALECHPDRGGSHQQMLLVNEAFEILANPETRRR